MPPMSAWCPLLATKNTGPLTPFLNTWGEKKYKEDGEKEIGGKEKNVRKRKEL